MSATEMRLEVLVLPVGDVDRAKDFYEKLGWRLDADVATGDDFRLVQFTPPASTSRAQRRRKRRCAAVYPRSAVFDCMRP